MTSEQIRAEIIECRNREIADIPRMIDSYREALDSIELIPSAIEYIKNVMDRSDNDIYVHWSPRRDSCHAAKIGISVFVGPNGEEGRGIDINIKIYKERPDLAAKFSIMKEFNKENFKIREHVNV